MKLHAAILSVLLLSCLTAEAQKPRFDRTTHDWGDVTVDDGPLHCTFTLTNDSREPVSIVSVVSSCGCTGVRWTRESIAPGKTGLIEATYSNDEGPYPFDKTLSVYTTASKRPTILHLKGYVHKTKMPLEQTHPVHIGPLGLRSARIKAGFMTQGGVKSGEISFANLSDKPVTLTFTDVPAEMQIGPRSVITPGQTASIPFSVYASRELWGTNDYPVTPVVDGKPLQKGSVVLWAVTKEDFSTWTKQQKASAATLEADCTSFSAGPVHQGQEVSGKFTLSNAGKSDLLIYKVECDSPHLSFTAPNGARVKPGGSLELPFTLDTSGRTADADDIVVISVYTNSPSSPVAFLYVSCVIVK